MRRSPPPWAWPSGVAFGIGSPASGWPRPRWAPTPDQRSWAVAARAHPGVHLPADHPHPGLVIIAVGVDPTWALAVPGAAEPGHPFALIPVGATEQQPGSDGRLREQGGLDCRRLVVVALIVSLKILALIILDRHRGRSSGPGSSGAALGSVDPMDLSEITRSPRTHPQGDLARPPNGATRRSPPQPWRRTGTPPPTSPTPSSDWLPRGLPSTSPQPVTLTPQGRAYAVAMVRRHRLLETFLVTTLGYPWEEVHGRGQTSSTPSPTR
ncbi:iron dependent repressor, metal binding and dimerization domain protein [Kocuria rhizophila]|nr:iron dependent repressor, metal binding and dimerization domain protein [Kocuria rhizophila]